LDEVEHPVVKALWLADFYAQLIETGAVNVNWNEMYGDSMLSPIARNSVRPLWTADAAHPCAQSRRPVARRNSSTNMVGAHATFRRDGFVGLMLVNKDPKSSVA